MFIFHKNNNKNIQNLFELIAFLKPGTIRQF